jgi:hypothetical protein
MPQTTTTLLQLCATTFPVGSVVPVSPASIAWRNEVLGTLYQHVIERGADDLPPAVIADLISRFPLVRADSRKVTEPFRFEFGEDVDGRPAIGFTHHGVFITNATESSCGRFSVDSMETYGLSAGLASAQAQINAKLRNLGPDDLPEFVGLWGGGYTPEGAFVARSSLSADNGYSAEDVEAVLRLPAGNSWESSDPAEHFIVRLR